MKIASSKGSSKSNNFKDKELNTPLPIIRKLGLRHALSAKAKNNELILVDGDFSDLSKTKSIKDKIEKLDLKNSLIVNNFDNDNPFIKAAKNIK